MINTVRQKLFAIVPAVKQMQDYANVCGVKLNTDSVYLKQANELLKYTEKKAKSIACLIKRVL
jgi:hypothetical protein